MNQTIPVRASSVLVLRILLSGIFLVASTNHLMEVEAIKKRIGTAAFKDFAYLFGEPETLIILSGVIMLLAGILLLLGINTRWSSLVLLLVLLPITITIQIGQISTLGPLFKNIAIMGGLLFFIINPNFKKEKP
ncbi:DoxX family membrane protein [Echinicola marina]|uniref:DoxX family membrane protein n=1 Tax=Echinicola marina TaxID=2859768 RepID=UPI001CF66CF9|nr:DoxX family membrane protein [Echinicola marina]UCS91696.1 DoxX family membrane protein [Echinicola marina]